MSAAGGRRGTSYGEPFSMQISTSDDIGRGDLAAPAVAGISCRWINTEYNF